MSETIHQKVMDRFEHVEQQLHELNAEIEEAVDVGVYTADVLEQFTQLMDVYKEIEEVIYGEHG
jgi:enamine deaminase RidA (YjgF/YER057c/UK114 family)